MALDARLIAQRAVQKARAATVQAIKPEAQTQYRRALLKAYPSEAWEESEALYNAAWQHYGNAPDQIVRFKQAGLVGQPKQLEFAYHARRADAPGAPYFIGFGGTRGPGKSFGVLMQAAVDDCQRVADLRVLYLRKTGKTAKEQLQHLFRAVLSYADCERTLERIIFPNGSSIVIGGFKDDSEALKYQGIEYDLIIIEEATQLEQSTIEALRLSMRTNKENWRPRMYLSANPLGRGHQWFKRQFVDPYRTGQITDSVFIPTFTNENRFINPDYMLQLQALTGAERQAYLDGNWDVAAGAYFETWRHNIHVIANFDSIPQGWKAWLSSDYGFNHWNVVQLHTKSPDGVYYTVAELCHRKTALEHIIPDVNGLLERFKLPQRDMTLVIGTDAFQKRGNAVKTVAETWQASHYKVKSANTERVAGWHDLAKLIGDPDNGIAPRWFVTKGCHKLIETLPYLERDPNNGEDVWKRDADENGKGGDDAGDCARYGIYSELKQFRFLTDED